MKSKRFWFFGGASSTAFIIVSVLVTCILVSDLLVVRSTGSSSSYEDNTPRALIFRSTAASVPKSDTTDTTEKTITTATATATATAITSVGVNKSGAAIQAPPRIAFITYAHLGNPNKFVKLILGALDTFLKNESTYFVVMTEQWQQTYADLCEGRELKLNVTAAVNCSRLTPIWVECREGYFQPAPSCKTEKGLAQVWDNYRNYYDWFLYMDDDDYLHTHVIQFYLSLLNPTESFAIGTSEPRVLGTSYFCPRCRYNCSFDNPNFKSVWGQPIIYSKAGLARVVGGFRNGGMVATCAAYEVFHDVGIAIFNWIHSLPSLSMGMAQARRNTTDNASVRGSRKQWIGYHGVANERHSYAEPSMHAIHQFHEQTTRHDYATWTARTPSDFRFLWHNATGFRETLTYAKFGDPSKWNASTWLYTKAHRDCQPRAKKAPPVVKTTAPPAVRRIALPPRLDFPKMFPKEKLGAK